MRNDVARIAMGWKQTSMGLRDHHWATLWGRRYLRRIWLRGELARGERHDPRIFAQSPSDRFVDDYIVLPRSGYAHRNLLPFDLVPGDQT